jgi:hypothetical protein
MESYLATKSSGDTYYKWRNLENIILSKRSQLQIAIYGKIHKRYNSVARVPDVPVYL